MVKNNEQILNSMNTTKLYKMILMIFLGSAWMVLHAQTGIPAAGGNASGTGGSVSFSVGQVFYLMNTGTTGSVLEGVQQPFEISETTLKTQTLTFLAGWNLFSFNIVPLNLDMKVNFQYLINVGRLVKIQNEDGRALEDYGAFGGWINNIGNILLTEGYKAKMTMACALIREGGAVILPFKIPLRTGWNIVGFPQTMEANGMEVVQLLINRGTLIKVQNEIGLAIEDFGAFGGWKNNMGNFIPGKGYKVKMKSSDTLTILASYAKAGQTVRQEAPVVHFRTVTEGNGVDHMNINLVGLQGDVWKAGDEIGIFDGDLCVGSLSLLPEDIKTGIISIPASAGDDEGEAGFTQGRPFTLKMWEKETGAEYLVIPEIIQGTPTFLKHESTLVNVEGFRPRGIPLYGQSIEVSCYPNPTSGAVHLKMVSFPEGGIQVEVMNSLGQLIMTREIVKTPAIIDLSGQVSGIYYLGISSKEWHSTEKIILK